MARQKLVEQTVLTQGDYKKIPLTEDKKVVLNEEGSEVRCIAAYTFPISRPDQENLNKRVYTSKLWEKVINEKQGERSYGLMDHPEDEGSVKDAWCVWRNVRMGLEEGSGKKMIYADAYLFGTHGEQVEAAMNAGGRVGLSSVGYGDFKKDGRTIEEDTYELDRVADFVLNPSYQVFGSKENSPQVESNSVEDSTINKESTSPEGKNQEESSEERKSTMSDVQKKSVMSLEEKNFRFSVRNLMKDAEAKESLREKMDSYEELLSYFDEENFAEDLREEVQTKLGEARKEYDQLAEKGTKLDEAQQTVEKSSTELEDLKKKSEEIESENVILTEKLSNAYELLDSMKAMTKKLRDLYDLSEARANGMISAKEYRELLVYTEEKEKELEEVQNELVETKLEIRKIREDAKIPQEVRKRYETAIEAAPDEPYEKPQKKRAVKESEDNDDDEDYDDEQGEVPGEQDTGPDEYDEAAFKNASPQVAAWYLKTEEIFPDISKVRDDILACRTIMEAQRKWLQLRSIVMKEDTSWERRSIIKNDVEKNVKKKPTYNALPKRKGWI